MLSAVIKILSFLWEARRSDEFGYFAVRRYCFLVVCIPWCDVFFPWPFKMLFTAFALCLFRLKWSRSIVGSIVSRHAWRVVVCSFSIYLRDFRSSSIDMCLSLSDIGCRKNVVYDAENENFDENFLLAYVSLSFYCYTDAFSYVLVCWFEPVQTFLGGESMWTQ